ncbi:MAG: PH domain-containing protein [Acidobacteriota bacterium]
MRALATLPALPITLAVLYFRYDTIRYEFSPEGIRMSWGVLFRHEIVLNYARIQDIHLRSNAIERWLGLARIEIQTGSGSSSAEMVLEGIPNPAAKRDVLYDRMRGAAAPAPDPNAGLAAILQEIAAEMRALRLALTPEGPPLHPHG